MIAIGELFVRILTDNKTFKAQMSDSSKELDRFSKSANGMKAAFDFAGKSVVAMGAAMNTVIGFMAKEAIDSEKANMRLYSALMSVGMGSDESFKKLDSNAKKLMRTTGISDGQAKESMIQLLNLTGRYEVASKHVKTAMDISAATGMNLVAVTRGLGMAYHGNTAMLSRMGIKLQEGVKGTKALEEASKQYQGAALAVSATTGGMWTSLMSRVKEVASAVGTRLLPAFQDAMKDGEKAATWWEKVLSPDTVDGMMVNATNLGSAVATFVTAGIVKAGYASKHLGMTLKDNLNLLTLNFKAHESFLKELAASKLEEKAAIAELEQDWKNGLLTVDAYRKRVQAVESSYKSLGTNVTKQLTEEEVLRQKTIASLKLASDNLWTFDSVIKSVGGVATNTFANIGQAAVATAKGSTTAWKDALKQMLGGILDFFITRVSAQMAWYTAAMFDPIFAPMALPGMASSAAQLAGLGALRAGVAMLAEGGIATRPTAGIFGEAGPEAIIPLNNKKAIDDFGLGGTTPNMTLVVQAQSIDNNTNWDRHIDKIKKAEARYKIRTGGR